MQRTYNLIENFYVLLKSEGLQPNQRQDYSLIYLFLHPYKSSQVDTKVISSGLKNTSRSKWSESYYQDLKITWKSAPSGEGMNFTDMWFSEP